MSELSEYMDNPHWMNMYKYAMGPPNDGHYKRWIQGSVGMMEPMHLWSNEYAFNYMKHGQNNIIPYRGNVRQFAPSVTPQLQANVRRCTNDTTNSAGCQLAAVRQVFSEDAFTPHPFNVSYQTGRSPFMPEIPPNGRRD